MASYSCSCASCRIGAICWPLVLLAAGVVFSLDLIWHKWPVWKTWPVLLVVLGLCQLAARLAPAHPSSPLVQPSSEVKHA